MGTHIALLCRNKEEGEKAVLEIRTETPNRRGNGPGNGRASTDLLGGSSDW